MNDAQRLDHVNETLVEIQRTLGKILEEIQKRRPYQDTHAAALQGHPHGDAMRDTERRSEISTQRPDDVMG